jgi:two-component system response regulator HydG
LLVYDWPGNVRELRNCVERAVTLTRSELVDLDDLPQKVREYNSAHVVVVGDDPTEIISLEEVEKRYILRVVEACRGNKSKAARALGIGRKTLYRRLESFGVALSDEDS